MKIGGGSGLPSSIDETNGEAGVDTTAAEPQTRPGGVGATGNINGTAANNTGQGPLRRVENGRQGEESMTIADFEKAVRGVYVSD